MQMIFLRQIVVKISPQELYMKTKKLPLDRIVELSIQCPIAIDTLGMFILQIVQ